MIEADECGRDDEPALGKRRPVGRQLDRWLERRRVVVREIADDRLRAAFRLRERDELGAAADERVAAEPTVLDRLEEKRRRCRLAQPEVRPEGSDEICGYDSGGVHPVPRKRKRPPHWLEVSASEAAVRRSQTTLPPRSLRHAHAHVEVGRVIVDGE